MKKLIFIKLLVLGIFFAQANCMVNHGNIRDKNSRKIIKSICRLLEKPTVESNKITPTLKKLTLITKLTEPNASTILTKEGTFLIIHDKVIEVLLQQLADTDPLYLNYVTMIKNESQKIRLLFINKTNYELAEIFNKIEIDIDSGKIENSILSFEKENFWNNLNSLDELFE